VGETRIDYTVFMENFKGRDHFGDKYIDGRII
jgi:hypothetical protein